MTTRRALIAGALAGAALAPLPAQAKPRVYGPDFDLSNTFIQPDVSRLFGSSPQAPMPAIVGSSPRGPTEEQTARALLAAAPKNNGPLGVMLYLEKLKAVNSRGEAYNGGWSDRANPLILEFFKATSTQPTQGDQTAWCAASLNWALRHCGYQHGTQSAASASFRNASGLTGLPRIGDIVVFQDVEPGKEGFGHVGIILTQTRNLIQVLGGNQSDTPGHASVNRLWLNVSDNKLKLHSFHAIEAFR